MRVSLREIPLLLPLVLSDPRSAGQGLDKGPAKTFSCPCKRKPPQDHSLLPPYQQVNRASFLLGSCRHLLRIYWKNEAVQWDRRGPHDAWDVPSISVIFSIDPHLGLSSTSSPGQSLPNAHALLPISHPFPFPKSCLHPQVDCLEIAIHSPGLTLSTSTDHAHLTINELTCHWM